MIIRRGALGWLLVALLFCGARPALAASPGAEELLEHVRQSWNPLRVQMTATLTLHRPGKPDSQFDVLIRRGEPEQLRIDFLAPPKDCGKVLLLEGTTTWLYLPRVGRVVTISPRQNPLGGALFTDLFPDDLTTYEAQVTESAESLGLDLRPKDPGAGTSSRIEFDRQTRLPLKREIYAAGGRLLKSILIEDYRLWQGVYVPHRLRIINRLGEGLEVTLDVTKIEPLAADAAPLFEKASLPIAAPGSSAARGLSNDPR